MKPQNAIILAGLTVLIVTVALGIAAIKTISQPDPSTLTANQSNTSQVISTTELARHNSSTSCYIAFQGIVYDITSFIPRHEGGAQILQECGKQVDDFSAIHPGGNFDSRKIQSQISGFKIGTLS